LSARLFFRKWYSYAYHREITGDEGPKHKNKYAKEPDEPTLAPYKLVHRRPVHFLSIKLERFATKRERCVCDNGLQVDHVTRFLSHRLLLQLKNKKRIHAPEVPNFACSSGSFRFDHNFLVPTNNKYPLSIPFLRSSWMIHSMFDPEIHSLDGKILWWTGMIECHRRKGPLPTNIKQSSRMTEKVESGCYGGMQ